MALTAASAADCSPELEPPVLAAETNERAVWLLIALLGTMTVALLVPLVAVGPVAGGIGIPWWVLLVAFMLCEILVVHVTFGRNSISYSLSEVPTTLSFGAVAPGIAVAVRLVGSLAGLVTQRVRGVKLAFNLASAGLEIVAATLVYRLVLGSAGPLEPRGWLAALAAALAVDLISGLSITAAMSLMDRRFDHTAIPEVLISSGVAAATNSCLAIITLIVIDHDPRAGIALAVIAGVVLFAYRAWTLQARRFQDMEVLYDFTRSLEEELDADTFARLTLTHALALTKASVAELVVVDDTFRPAQQWTLDSDGRFTSACADSVLFGLDLEAGSECLAASSHDPRTRSRLEALGRSEVLITPVRSSRTMHGVLMTADRQDAVSKFKPADLRLLEALASHVAVELDNTQLMSRLRVEAAEKEHLALHDVLTDLPNRRWFTLQVQAAFDAGEPLAVMLMDLDRFKEVNDTLGHPAGDQVLLAVARRLNTALGDRGSVARFGGDEFAVLTPFAASEQVCAVADELVAALHPPVMIGELAVDLGVSIGVAVAPVHGETPEILLQHADVAMYLAKDRQSDVEVYSFEHDINDVRRLNLVSELRRAVASGALQVHYQPKVDVASEQIIGVEALVRWTSEQYGPIAPDEFVPLAECTGLIGPLTEHVLSVAVRDCMTWRSTGWEGSVSVNISTRSLTDHEFPDLVAREMKLVDLPPAALILEMTETNIMRDPARNVDVLRELAQLGVQISIDDFGTGYSSLAYLKRLPVCEVKIDKSFLASIEWDEEDQAIVRATIRLAHDLGLKIVAEGVETVGSLALLKRWGADIAQGYYFGRPISAAELSVRLNKLRLSLVSAAR